MNRHGRHARVPDWFVGFAVANGYTAADYAVYLAIAAHADVWGEAYPSHGAIAALAGGMDRRTIQRALRRLEATGGVEIRVRGTGRRATHYYVPASAEVPGSERAPVAPQTPSGRARAAPRGTSGDSGAAPPPPAVGSGDSHAAPGAARAPRSARAGAARNNEQPIEHRTRARAREGVHACGHPDTTPAREVNGLTYCTTCAAELDRYDPTRAPVPTTNGRGPDDPQP